MKRRGVHRHLMGPGEGHGVVLVSGVDWTPGTDEMSENDTNRVVAGQHGTQPRYHMRAAIVRIDTGHDDMAGTGDAAGGVHTDARPVALLGWTHACGRQRRDEQPFAHRRRQRDLKET